MATGRTTKRWARIYVDGVDLSGYTREVGPLSWTYPEVELVSLLDAVKGALPDQPEIGIGTLNGIFDNTATVGIHAALSTAGVSRKVLIAQGIRGDPAQGDPVFMGAFNHNGYAISPSGGDIALTCPFGKTSPAEGMLYEQPWGVLLHANSQETGANTAVGVDDFGAGTLPVKGGYLVCHILSVTGTGSVTVSLQDASTNSNGSFGALNPVVSTGAIAHTAIPYAGIIQLGIGATIKRYVRWQIAFSTITAAYFVLGFCRGR